MRGMVKTSSVAEMTAELELNYKRLIDVLRQAIVCSRNVNLSQLIAYIKLVSTGPADRFAILVLCSLFGFSVNESAAGEIKPPQRISNAYCSVPTYVLPKVTGHARAALQPNGQPVIHLDAGKSSDTAYARFLLAHECCHHTRRHLQQLQEHRKRGVLLMLSRLNWRLELDADCCAAAILREKKDHKALQSARRVMSAYGAGPTGPRYPGGSVRASIIKKCGGLR